MPSATTWVRSAISRPSSIITARRTSSRRRLISSESAVRVRSMNISDTAVFDVDEAVCSIPSPTGSPACWKRRVETPASMRSITARVSRSRSEKCSYVDTGSSCSSSAVRILGRRTWTRRPPRVIEPSSWPWRLAVRSGLCLPFGPTTSSTSSSISSCTTPRPTPTLSASSPSLAAPTSSPRASWTRGGSGLSTAFEPVTTCRPDTFFMAASSCLGWTSLAQNAANGNGRGRRTAAQSSTRLGTTSGDAFGRVAANSVDRAGSVRTWHRAVGGLGTPSGHCGGLSVKAPLSSGSLRAPGRAAGRRRHHPLRHSPV